MDWINSGQFTFSCSFGMIVLIISIIPLEPSWLNDSLCSDSKLNRKLDFLVQVSLIWFRLKFHSSCHQFRPKFPLHFGGGFLCFENDLFSPLLWYRSRFHFDFEMQFHWLCNCVKCQQKSNWFQLNSLNFFFFFCSCSIGEYLEPFFLFRKFNPIVSNRFRFSWIFPSFAAFRCLRHVENWYFAVWTRSISYRFSSFRLNFFNLCIVFEYLGSEKRIELLENRYDFNWILFQSN